MKESITKFDLEAAFKALDDIETPIAEQGIKANKPALTEIFSRKSKFDSLFEEYYDIGNSSELSDAKEAREAEIAKAKLARIEKIVDLDAETPEDLLTSYVGKFIIQCPQCMTLFYKNPEDVVEAEDDPSTVNIEEICQHCGNDSGYTLIGKVGEVETENPAEVPVDELAEDEDLDLEIPTEEAPEEASEESTEGDLNSDLEAIDLEEPQEDDKKEESFTVHEGETLIEEIQDDKELDTKLEAHSEYIEYLRTTISQEEETLEKTSNEQVRAAIQRRIDAFKTDLENALPDAIKNDEVTVEESSDEPAELEEVTENLTESLHEEATDFDVSAEEFETLIKSPEFKKPISDSDARAMMQEFEDTQDIEEEFLEKSTSRAEKPEEDATLVEKLEIAVLEESCAEEGSSLNEGSLADLSKAIGKKIKQTGQALKNKASAAIDKLTDNVKTREEKADWVLANAMDDYSNTQIDTSGKLIPDENNRRFTTFIVIGYKEKFSNDKLITAAPSFNNKDLVIGMNKPEVKNNYADADAVAQGWSQRQGNGPAFIYLAKDINDAKAVFLCQYFKGELTNDQLEKYFNIVKKDVEAAALLAKGKLDQQVDESESTVNTEDTKASELKQGMKIRFDKEEAEVLEIGNSRFGNNTIAVKVKFTDGSEETININTDATFQVISKTNESIETSKVALATIMENLDELQENTLEQLISDSLTESYKNVAGFKLTSCNYLDEQFNINGTIYFTSGNARKTTYKFTEAYTKEDKISILGLNEKLGGGKQFIVTGSTKNKTFIVESFNYKK